MANPSVLQSDTVLYCAAEPAGRLWPAGSEWPGDAWSANRGGEPIGGATVAQSAKDLLAAQHRIDSQADQLDSQTHDLAVMAAERDAAVGKLADAEQRAIAAETAKGESDEAARNYMLERDQARSQLQAANEAVEAAKAEAGKVPDLMAQLDAANQANADLNGKVASLTADLEVATAPKPTKAAKTEAAPAPEVEQPADPA